MQGEYQMQVLLPPWLNTRIQLALPVCHPSGTDLLFRCLVSTVLGFIPRVR